VTPAQAERPVLIASGHGGAVHQNSLDLCRLFANGLKLHRGNEPLSIADVGSIDLNGTYRSLFDLPGWRYIGFDIRPGKNVDVVLAGPDDWKLPDEHREVFDVVISGQVLEHVAAPWRWIKDVASLCSPGGLIWISAPNTEVFHEHPLDCWRVWPDGMRAILREGGLEEFTCAAVGPDTVAIARKPK
jgi:SAM-dependent methyltransferase